MYDPLPSVKIDKNIPIPEILPNERRTYPFRDLQPGDSFLVQGNKDYVRQLVNRWRSLTEFDLVYLKTDEGYRVWRRPEFSRPPVEKLDEDKLWNEAMREEQNQHDASDGLDVLPEDAGAAGGALPGPVA